MPTRSDLDTKRPTLEENKFALRSSPERYLVRSLFLSKPLRMTAFHPSALVRFIAANFRFPPMLRFAAIVAWPLPHPLDVSPRVSFQLPRAAFTQNGTTNRQLIQ